jgi:iron complex transport system permease protein
MKRAGLAAGAAFFAVAFACFAGSDGLHWPSRDIFFLLRLPRVMLGLCAGAALSAGGVTCQALLRNPLADPYVLGLSGGAALGAVLVSALGAPPLWAVLAAACAGAWIASLLVFAAPGRAVPVGALLLSGVVFNAFAAAVIMVIKTLISANKAQEILFWLMGQLEMYDYYYIGALTIVVLIGLAMLLWHGRALDVLVQGDDTARALGVDLTRVRWQLYFALTLLIGSVVAATGLIGFVGLVIPHLVRARTGARHRPLLVLSAIWGAVLVVVADGCCRLAFVWFATELPVGVLTAFIGAPFFVGVLRRSRSGELFS